MRIRRDVNGNVEIKCFLQDMENYLAVRRHLGTKGTYMPLYILAVRPFDPKVSCDITQSRCTKQEEYNIFDFIATLSQVGPPALNCVKMFARNLNNVDLDVWK